MLLLRLPCRTTRLMDTVSLQSLMRKLHRFSGFKANHARRSIHVPWLVAACCPSNPSSRCNEYAGTMTQTQVFQVTLLPTQPPVPFCSAQYGTPSSLSSQLDKRTTILFLKDNFQSLVPGPSPQRRPYTIAHRHGSTFDDDFFQAGKRDSTVGKIFRPECASPSASCNRYSKLPRNPHTSDERAERVIAV